MDSRDAALDGWCYSAASCSASARAPSGEQWAEWRSHPSHFASGDHMGFSLKNMGDTPRVNKKDVQEAGTQSWWGKPVVPRPGQIFEE